MVSFDLEKGSFATLPRAEKRENHCQEVKNTFPLLSESSIPFLFLTKIGRVPSQFLLEDVHVTFFS